VTLRTIEDANREATEYLKAIEPPAPGYKWIVAFEMELADAWLFSFSLEPVASQGTEELFLAGALGYAIPKNGGEIQPLSAPTWSDAVSRGALAQPTG